MRADRGVGTSLSVRVFAVHQSLIFGVWEDNALFYIARLWQLAADFDNAFRFGYFGRNYSILKPLFHLFIEWFFVG